MVGNGFCNDEANNENCNYDNGDCCGCVVTNHCVECACLDANNTVQNALVGDGVCNDEINNVECSFDGGDCCNSDANMDSCTSCVCFLEETCLAGVHPLVGNDFCNDETNIKECDYDGFECCGFHSSSYNVNQDSCTDCLCKGMYFIIQQCVCINEALN